MIAKRAKPDLLNGRYVLKNCLFGNELGHLYHARDTQYSSPSSSGLPVLVHFLPSRAISYNDVPGTFERLKKTIGILNQPILPITGYGWNGTESYFVMAAPDSWSVKVLPELQHSTPSSLHQTAMIMSSELRKSGHISRGLTPQTFLVIPGELKLLGTALIKQFQAIQPEKDLLPPPYTRRINKKTMVASLGLVVLTGALVAGNHAFYTQWNQAQAAAINPGIMTEEAALPDTQFLPTQTQANTSATSLDIPYVNNLRPPVLAPYRLAKTLPKLPAQVPAEEKPVANNKERETRQPDTLQITTAPEPKKAMAKSKTKPSALKKVKSAKKRKKAKKTRPALAKKQQTAIPPVAEVSPDKSDFPDRNIVNQMITTKPRLTANGLNSEQLKNKAYAALSSGALGEKPNTGSIFYIRLLKRIDDKNPHIHRLARGVVSAYHTQARQKMKQQQKQESRRLLWVAGRVIKEFNLMQMNQAHTMLKQRQSE